MLTRSGCVWAQGATLVVSHERGEGHPPLLVATMRHGGVFGGEAEPVEKGVGRLRGRRKRGERASSWQAATRSRSQCAVRRLSRRELAPRPQELVPQEAAPKWRATPTVWGRAGEGALLALPAVCSVTCVASGAPLLTLSQAQLQLLRSADPALLQQLHAASFGQMQDCPAG